MLFNKILLPRIPQVLTGSALLLTAQLSLLADVPKPRQLGNAGAISIQASLPSSTATSSRHHVSGPSTGRWDAGSISALDENALTHDFLLKNTGTTPLTVSRIQTSCGCTSALPATDKGLTSLPLTLASGQSMTVHARVNLALVAPGPLSKSVMLYSDPSPRPVAVLQLTGTLRPSLALSPPLLDFGQVAGGKGNTLAVTATWDEHLTPDGTLPALVSTNPDISVMPQPEIKALLLKVPGPSPFLHRGTRICTYRVVVSPTAALGPISGMLSFQAPKSSAGAVPKNSLDRRALQAAIYSQPTVLLLGQVQGDLAAQPQALTFNRVRQGQPASREIVLTGIRLETLKSLSVATASPWLTARLSPATPVFSGGQLQATSQVLDVSLSPNTPPGLFASTLKITLTNGQHLRVPVTADVSNVGL